MTTIFDTYHQHRSHHSFRVQGNPMRRTYGVVCSCENPLELEVSFNEIRLLADLPKICFLRVLTEDLNRAKHLWNRSLVKAARRARILLHSCLTKQQRCDLKKNQAFTVVGRDQVTYRIHAKESHNVQILKEGKPTHTLCVVAKEWIPVYDLMLAQKLLLESNPEGFTTLANVTTL